MVLPLGRTAIPKVNECKVPMIPKIIRFHVLDSAHVSLDWSNSLCHPNAMSRTVLAYTTLLPLLVCWNSTALPSHLRLYLQATMASLLTTSVPVLPLHLSIVTSQLPNFHLASTVNCVKPRNIRSIDMITFSNSETHRPSLV